MSCTGRERTVPSASENDSAMVRGQGLACAGLAAEITRGGQASAKRGEVRVGSKGRAAAGNEAAHRFLGGRFTRSYTMPCNSPKAHAEPSSTPTKIGESNDHEQLGQATSIQNRSMRRACEQEGLIRVEYVPGTRGCRQRGSCAGGRSTVAAREPLRNSAGQKQRWRRPTCDRPPPARAHALSRRL